VNPQLRKSIDKECLGFHSNQSLTCSVIGQYRTSNRLHGSANQDQNKSQRLQAQPD
jgi:hypothetical protein